MITRELQEEDKIAYNQLVKHPLQSWEWGEFRKKTGVDVVRIGTFEENKLISGYQLTFHQIPYLPFTIGYCPKGEMWDENMLSSLTKIGQEKNAIFIKLEPNVINQDNKTTRLEDSKINNKTLSVLQSSNLRSYHLVSSPKPLFTKYTFYIDLTKNENDLFNSCHPKTRYNIRLAQKYGVTVQEENTQDAFNRYLELTQETTRRQQFYAHTPDYHKKMWETLRSNMAHLFTARYQGKILTCWILFLFNNVLYYPYGASTTEFKEVMASNLMMWETIRFGKTNGATIFDLWGTPGPNPEPTDNYFGFHKFKMGYNPQLIEFIGTYDLVLQPIQYTLFNLTDRIRWFMLKLKAKLNLS